MRHGPRGFTFQSARFINQRKFFGLFLRRVDNLLALDSDLVGIQLARALHRKPFPQRHRNRAGQQASQPGDQDLLAGKRRSGDTHHQAQVGNQAVIGAQHCRAQSIAARPTVAAFQNCQRRSGHAAAGMLAELVENTRVRAFIAHHLTRLGLGAVPGGTALFHALHRRQHQLRAKTARQPQQHRDAQRRAKLGYGFSAFLQQMFPLFGVLDLHRGHAPVNLGQTLIRFTFCQHTVQRRAASLVSPVVQITRFRFCIHC